jgi:hypothetical protein
MLVKQDNRLEIQSLEVNTQLLRHAILVILLNIDVFVVSLDFHSFLHFNYLNE